MKALRTLITAFNKFKSNKAEAELNDEEKEFKKIRTSFSNFLVKFAEATGYFKMKEDPNIAKAVFGTSVSEIMQLCANAVIKFLFNGEEIYTDKNNISEPLKLINREGIVTTLIN
jgi:hypothetical protein